MVDNVAITAGSGTTVAADDVGGVLFQRVKPAFGADGSATDVAPSAGLPVVGGYLELSGTAAALNADIIASTDVRGYQSFSVQATGFGTATIRVQGSNDNTNWADLLFVDPSSISTAPSSGITSSGIRIGAVTTRYLRVRAVSYSSGTIAGTLELSPAPYAPATRHLSTVSAQLSVAGAGSLADATANSVSVLPAGAFGMGYNGSAWDRLRVPTVVKTVAATASGNTALWTPTSGKKFRLQRYRVELSGDATISGGGVLTVKFQDATTDVPVAHSVYVPSVAANLLAGWQSGWIDLGNGVLSAAANNVLNVNLSAALASGTCRVVACGTEE